MTCRVRGTARRAGAVASLSAVVALAGGAGFEHSHRAAAGPRYEPGPPDRHMRVRGAEGRDSLVRLIAPGAGAPRSPPPSTEGT